MDMDAPRRSRSLPDLATAAEEELDEVLVHWDELRPGDLEELATHPLLGPRLAALQRAEAWLSEQGSGDAPPGVAACPSPEELYDYGRGPGYSPLPPERRVEIDRHLLRCEACKGFAEALERRPPVPLDLPLAGAPSLSIGADRPSAPGTDGGEPEVGSTPAVPLPRRRSGGPRPAPPADLQPPGRSASPRRGRPRLARLASLAAAAALAASLPLLLRPSGTEHGFPAPPPVLRGRAADALLFPRGLVLARSPALAGIGLRPDTPLRFEIAPIEGASGYRVELLRAAADPFAAGDRVALLESAEPTLAAEALSPGRYTWRAFADVGGLERFLGERDFEVREDPELVRRLLARADSDAPQRGEALVRLLDEAGYLVDARALARTLPPSPERDAYLARVPGR